MADDLIKTKEEYIELYEKHGSIKMMMAMALKIGEIRVRKRRNELFSQDEINSMNNQHKQKPMHIKPFGQPPEKYKRLTANNGSGDCEVWSFDKELYERTGEIKKLELLRVQGDSWDAVRWG